MSQSAARSVADLSPRVGESCFFISSDLCYLLQFYYSAYFEILSVWNLRAEMRNGSNCHGIMKVLLDLWGVSEMMSSL